MHVPQNRVTQHRITTKLCDLVSPPGYFASTFSYAVIAHARNNISVYIYTHKSTYTFRRAYTNASYYVCSCVGAPTEQFVRDTFVRPRGPHRNIDLGGPSAEYRRRTERESATFLRDNTRACGGVTTACIYSIRGADSGAIPSIFGSLCVRYCVLRSVTIILINRDYPHHDLIMFFCF